MSGRDTESNVGIVDDKEQDIEEILSKVDDTTFIDDDWNIVVIETKSLSYSWEQLSVYLGLPFDLIDNYIRPASNPWNEALKQWIKHNYNTKRFGQPSWRTLLKAVAQVNILQCKKLADKHRVETHVPSTTAEEPKASICNNMVADTAKPLTTTVKDTKSSEKVASSIVTTKPKLAFHCLSLNLNNMSEDEKQCLQRRLYTESEDMMYKFQEFFTSTANSLSEREVPVKELSRHLRCLGTLKPTLKDSKDPPLMVELDKTESIDGAMSVVSKYCSFFNYRLLEHIIDKLGAEQDRENLARYKEDFTKYGKRHVFECPAVVGEIREEGQANMFVTLDNSFDNCNVNHLYAFVSNLERVLNIDNMSLRLCRIAPGSLNLIFQLPLPIQLAVFPLSNNQEAALTGLGVTHLSCGDYQFTREEKMETGYPASDEDSGHGDYAEDSMDSVYLLSRDAEVASLADRPVVGKSVGDSVITDSALGRSTTAASVTTTGLTQFSENLFDRGLADLDMGMGQSGTGTSNKVHAASCRGDLEEVKRLIEKEGFNPLQTDGESGRNALHYAARGGHHGMMKYFIKERGCNPACQDSDGVTPLHYAAYYNHLELVQYLVNKENVDPTCLTIAGNTPLHHACIGGNINVLTFLVNAMTEYLPLTDVVEFKGQDGHHPVHLAALYGHLEVIKFFVTKLGLDPLIADDRGTTTLHYAANNGHLHIVKYFTEQLKCNPAPIGKNKFTPLHYAAWKGHVETVEYLTLKQHCDPLCVGCKTSPLHLAAFFGQLEVIKFFVETLHCPTDIRADDNSTPLILARLRGHDHVVQYLESITM